MSILYSFKHSMPTTFSIYKHCAASVTFNVNLHIKSLVSQIETRIYIKSFTTYSY
jgi:hypothetical protein